MRGSVPEWLVSSYHCLSGLSFMLVIIFFLMILTTDFVEHFIRAIHTDWCMNPRTIMQGVTYGVNDSYCSYLYEWAGVFKKVESFTDTHQSSVMYE